MKAVDTNVLVRYLVQDDPVQGKKAASFFESAVDEDVPILIGNTVLCELVWVLDSAYDYAKTDLVDVLEKILATAGFAFESKDIVRAALEEYRSTNVDFSDGLMGRIHKSLGADTTVTFDNALRKLDTFR